MLQLVRQSIPGEFSHSDLTSKIIACAIQVHSQLGNGFQEDIYQRALAIELAGMNLTFVQGMELPVYYEQQQIGSRRIDFLIENKVLLELKVVVQLSDTHLAQAIHYLEASDVDSGLLLNFGNRILQYKRVDRL